MSKKDDEPETVTTIISSIGTTIVKVLSNDDVKSTLLGEYADGTTRNLPDAINGETLSPKQKEKVIKRAKKHKKHPKKFKL